MMEGEKERQRERGEEKESDETEEDAEGAALLWQEGSSDDDLGLPIMHWEALSLRIAQLEKQEEQRREKNKDVAQWTETWPELYNLTRHQDTCEEVDDSHLTALTTRLQSHMNLQLCFINNSESEDEEEDQEKKEMNKHSGKQMQQPQQHSSTASSSKPKSGGFKKEVKAALSSLRHKLRLEQKQTKPPSDIVKERTHYNRSDLQNFSIKELNAQKTTLSKDIH
ncbi:schwannomin-interacting protein 1-like, partial [Clarias magur]